MMTRALRLFVLATHLAAGTLGAVGLCLCVDTPPASAGSCCERLSRPGGDCCAPARDQLSSSSAQAFERAAAVEMPASVAFIAHDAAPRPAAVVVAAAPDLPRPDLVLRI
jgi:hypothetical protein